MYQLQIVPQDVDEKADEVVPQNLSIVSSTVIAIFITVFF